LSIATFEVHIEIVQDILQQTENTAGTN